MKSLISGGIALLLLTSGAAAQHADNCADAPLAVAGSYTIDTTAATNDGTATCGLSATSADVWIKYTGPMAGTARFSTCGSTLDTVLSAYDGCGGAQLVCLDDSCGFQTTIGVNVASGQTIWIRIAGYNNAVGTATLVVTDPAPPANNDACADAIALTPGSTTSFDTSSATNDGTASCGLSAASPDIWFTFRSTTAGEISIDSCGSAYDTVLSILDGCGGTELNCNDDACGLQSRISRIIDANTTYWLRVSGYANLSGAGVLNLSTVTAVTAWDEQLDGGGDAGGLPDTAQSATGTGPLTRIAGTVEAGGEDMFRINICDASAFSATVVGGATFDTQLCIFNIEGIAVVFDDDSQGTLQSTLTSTFISGTGDYYLAISGYDHDPVDGSGVEFWVDTPFGVERQPDGGGTGAISSWIGAGGSGTYVIRLTGTCFVGGLPDCIADVDDGTGTGTRDGAVTLEDLLYYLVLYDAGTIGADVDNGTFTGTRDGAVTLEDLLYFLFRYEAGC